MGSFSVQFCQMRRSCAVLAALLCCIGSAAGQSAWQEQSADSAFLRVVVMGADALTASRAEDLGREFLAGPARQKRLAKLDMASNDFDVSNLEYHGLTLDYDHTNALAELKFGYPFRGPVARVLKFRDWALLDYRSDAVHFTEVLLNGAQNAARLAEGSSTYRLLDFALTGTKVLSLTVFLESSPKLSSRDAGAVGQKLMEELSLSSLIVSIRTDTWFLDERHFPLLFPFSQDVSIPTEYMYLAKPSLTCWLEKGRLVACNGRNFQP